MERYKPKKHKIPVEVVSNILGHKSIQTTQVYARVKRETVKEAMKVFDAR